MASGAGHTSRSRRALILRIGVGLAAICLGCAREAPVDPEVRFRVDLDPGRPRVGPLQVTVRLLDPRERPVAGSEVHLEGGMNHAGMVPSLGQAREQEPGIYRGQLDLTMPGDWFLLVEARLPNGQTATHKLALTAVGGT